MIPSGFQNIHIVSVYINPAKNDSELNDFFFFFIDNLKAGLNTVSFKFSKKLILHNNCSFNKFNPGLI